MKRILVYLYADTPALVHARKALESRGVECTSEPSSRVTHLLLGVPSLDANGNLRNGDRPEAVLSRVSPEVTVVGGKLEDPAFASYNRIDLLEDEKYLAENAALTADCALRLAGEKLPVAWKGCPVLILGWGRIGKCLAKLLQALGAQVAVSARRESHLAMLSALGYDALPPKDVSGKIERYRVVFNTVPSPILTQDADCTQNLWIDLASRLGLEGENVLWARGLPGKMLPESSGRLIGTSFLRILLEGGRNP